MVQNLCIFRALISEVVILDDLGMHSVSLYSTACKVQVCVVH